MLKKSTIRTRLYYWAGLALAVVLILSAIGAWALHQNRVTSEEIRTKKYILGVLAERIASSGATVAYLLESSASAGTDDGLIEAQKIYDRLKEDVNKARSLSDNDSIDARLDKFEQLSGQILESGEKIITLEMDQDFEAMPAAVQEFENHKQAYFAVGTQIKEQTLQEMETALELMSTVSYQGLQLGLTTTGIFIIFMPLITWWIIRSIYKPLTDLSQSLNYSASQVGMASQRLSTTNQNLADGTAQQAASIEETSSSLEEMSSMTNQNADNCTQADQLMQSTIQVVKSANEHMAQLIDSMRDISDASKETLGIIKTIDDIAFQTNLLALNAAVEAARAGDSGAGFAVVADEVRNLAMRAAEAASSTSERIEGTVKKVEGGGTLVNKTHEAFLQVAESAAKIAELVGEVSAASKEQAQGIEQINTTVVEVDKVVQRNAAVAEQSASASEELSSQADQMHKFVVDLTALIGRSKKDSNDLGSVKEEVPQARTPFFHQEKNELFHPYHGRSAEIEISPKQVIPLDDDEFEDFKQ
jgi:methyl-accepting chemotaxis protein